MGKQKKYRSTMLPMMRFSMEEMIGTIARLDADQDALDVIDYARGILDQVDSMMDADPEYIPDEELVAAYQSGMSMYDVVANFDVSINTVQSALRRLGVKARKRGSGRALYRKMGANPQRTEEMITLHNKGWTLEEIGSEYKITRERVRQLLTKAGINTSDRPLKEEQLAIVNEYLAGDSLCVVCEKHDITLTTLKGWINKAGYKVRPSNRMHSKAVQNKAKKAAELYETGMKASDIAERLGTPPNPSCSHGGAVYRYLAIAGVKPNRIARCTPKPKRLEKNDAPQG